MTLHDDLRNFTLLSISVKFNLTAHLRFGIKLRKCAVLRQVYAGAVNDVKAYFTGKRKGIY